MFISGHLIVKETTNFGKMMLTAALESVKDFVDELIVIDNGCSCSVQDAMTRFNINFDGHWSETSMEGDFSELRNKALENMNPKANYIFQFDSYDIFWPQNLNKMRTVLGNEEQRYKWTGRFYHFMESPFFYQSIEKHTNLYPAVLDMKWEKSVHEELVYGDGYKFEEKDLGEQYIWTHWGYVRSVIHITLKWLYYDYLEFGNVDRYKEKDSLLAEMGINDILIDRIPLLKRFKKSFPPAAWKYLIAPYEKSSSLDWQHWVKNIDPQFLQFEQDFHSVAFEEGQVGYVKGTRPYIKSIERIFDEKLWEKF